MTVKINKPAVNLREELNELKKPTGLAGEAMLRAETPQEQFNLIGAGRRNLLINGDFRVWQRGEGPFTLTESKYTVDRWNTFNANATLVVSHGTDDPYRDYAAWTVTVKPTSDRVQPQQVIEKGLTPNTQYTLSFLARGIGFLDDVELRQGGATSQFFIPEDKVLRNGTEWVKYTHTFTTPSNMDKDNTVALIWHLSQSTDKLELSEAQLELGNVATPFEHRSYGEELALCQRYFNRLGGGTYTGITTGMVFNNTSSMFCITYPVPMRAGPTISSSGLVVSDRISYDSAVTSFQPQGTSTTGIHFKTVHASNGASSRQAVVLVVQNNGTGYMDFNAEL